MQMRIRKSSVERLVSQISLPDHFRRYLELKMAGGHFMALCPFHAEKTPSFYVYADHYHCFSCKAHGTILDYEIHRTGQTFYDCVRQLASEYRIELEYEPSHTSAEGEARQALFAQQNLQLEQLWQQCQKNLPTTGRASKIAQALVFWAGEVGFFRHNFSPKNSQEIDGLFLVDRSGEKISAHAPHLRGRLCLPLRRDNGHLCGFLLSSPIQEQDEGEPPDHPKEKPQDQRDIYELIQQIFEHSQRLAHWSSLTACVGWERARVHAAKEKTLYVVHSLALGAALAARGWENVVAVPWLSGGVRLMKMFSSRVQKVVFCLANTAPERQFLWKQFTECLELSDPLFQVCMLPYDDTLKACQGALLPKEISSTIQSLILGSFRLLQQNHPELSKRDIFRRWITPYLAKVEDKTRRKALQEELSAGVFSGSRLDVLAKSTNVIVQREDPIALVARATQFYAKCLTLGKNSQVVQEYLKNRGFDESVWARWEFGYAPSGAALYRKVQGQHAVLRTLRTFGFFRERRGSMEDFFKYRLTLPIYDHQGRVVACAGRLVEGVNVASNDGPKYLNSPESSFFSKARILFNYSKALPAMARSGFALLVEGYMDCIRLVEAGVENTVAVMGTALTSHHVASLGEIVNRIVICFDADSAGEAAARRSLGPIFQAEIPLAVDVLRLPAGDDPDSYLQKFGVEAFQKLLAENVQPLYVVVVEAILKAHPTPEDFLRTLRRDFLPQLLRAQKQVQKEVVDYLRALYPPLAEELRDLQETTPQPLAHKKRIDPRNVLPEKTASLAPAQISWVVRGRTEVRILLSLLLASWDDLPQRLQQVLLGEQSVDLGDAKYCALALQRQFSQGTFALFVEVGEVLLTLQGQPGATPAFLPREEWAGFSRPTQALLAWINGDAVGLSQFGLQGLLKEDGENNQVLQRPGTTEFDIFQTRNSFILKKILRIVSNSRKKNILKESLSDDLTTLEEGFLKKEMEKISKTHNNADILLEFENLYRELVRRKAASRASSL